MLTISRSYVVSELMKLEPEALSIFVLQNKMKTKKAEFPAEVSYLAAEEVHDEWFVYPWEALDYQDHEEKARAKKFISNSISR